jgi:hypothetical protein
MRSLSWGLCVCVCVCVCVVRFRSRVCFRRVLCNDLHFGGVVGVCMRRWLLFYTPATMHTHRGGAPWFLISHDPTAIDLSPVPLSVPLSCLFGVGTQNPCQQTKSNNRMRLLCFLTLQPMPVTEQKTTCRPRPPPSAPAAWARDGGAGGCGGGAAARVPAAAAAGAGGGGTAAPRTQGRWSWSCRA